MRRRRVPVTPYCEHLSFWQNEGKQMRALILLVLILVVFL